MSCQQKACSLCKVKNHSECKIEHIPSIVGSQEFKNEFRNVVKTIENDLEAIAVSKTQINSKLSDTQILRKNTKASMEKQKYIVTKDIENNYQRWVSHNKQMQTQEMTQYERRRANLLAKKDREKDELLNKLKKEKDELLAKLNKEKNQLINNHQGQNKRLQENREITIDKMEIEEKKLDKQSESIQLKDETRLQDLSYKANQNEMKLKHLKQTMSGKMSGNQKFEVFLTMQEATHILENTKQMLEDVSQCDVSFYEFQPSTEKVSALQTSNVISYGCIKKQSEIKRNIKQNNPIFFNKEHSTEKLYFSITGLCKISDCHLIAADESNKSIKILDIDKKLITTEQNLEDGPFDVTLVTNNSVATTVPHAKKIQLLSVTDDYQLSLQSQIPVEDKCYGIAFKKPTFIVGCPGKVQMLEINGNIVKTIATSGDIPLQIRVHPTTDALYITERNCAESYVSKPTLTKILIDTPTDRITCKLCAAGLTIDKSGTIYTTDGSHIVQISDDLQTHYVHSFDLFRSKCLHYCDKENKVYVSTRTGTLNVYDIKMPYLNTNT